MDLDKVRQERRKAKANRTKYTGVGSEGFNGRMGGFGDDSYYSGSSGGGYSGGGGSSGTPRKCMEVSMVTNGLSRPERYGGGSSSGGFRDDSGRRGYDDYDAGDDEVGAGARRSTSVRSPVQRSTSGSASAAAPPPPKAAPKEKEKVVTIDNLLDWDDDTAAAASSSNQNKALPTVLDTSLDGM